MAGTNPRAPGYQTAATAAVSTQPRTAGTNRRAPGNQTGSTAAAITQPRMAGTNPRAPEKPAGRIDPVFQSAIHVLPILEGRDHKT